MIQMFEVMVLERARLVLKKGAVVTSEVSLYNAHLCRRTIEAHRITNGAHQLSVHSLVIVS